jgi:hypothetical protein
MRGVGTALRRLGHATGILVALIYVAFGLTDMFLSLAAFSLGVPEANPFMGWLLAHNLFVPGKVLLTGTIAVLIAISYPAKRARPAIWAALLVTAAVDAFHVWGLSVV